MEWYQDPLAIILCFLLPLFIGGPVAIINNRLNAGTGNEKGEEIPEQKVQSFEEIARSNGKKKKGYRN